MKHALVAVIALAAIYGLIAGFSACSDVSTATPSSDAASDHDNVDGQPEAAVDAADAYNVPAWDPVWRKTTPADFAIVPPGPALSVDCGERCKVIASTSPESIMTRRPRANDDWVVFQTLDGRVHAVNVASGVEYLISDGSEWTQTLGTSWGTGVPSLSGDRVFYGVVFPNRALLVLTDLKTGETKQVWTSEDTEIGAGPSTTAFAHPFVYWDYSPPSTFYRFNVETGELKSVDGGGCYGIDGSSVGLATCASEGSVSIIDFDSGARTAVGAAGFAEGIGGISPDGKAIAWIDLRHPGPNGEKSTWFEPAAGSEVYTLDVSSKVETRITFDSPDSPVLKTEARVAGDVLLWHAPSIGLDGSQLAPVWFRKGSGPITQLGPQTLGRSVPIASGVVAVGAYGPDGGGALVLISWPPSSDGG